MANISGVSNNFLDSILPPYGNPRVKTPIWNESQHMFITDQYTLQQEILTILVYASLIVS